MRPIVVGQAGLGSTRPVPLDHYRGPFNVGMGVVVAPGSTLTYTVEHTFDNVYDPAFNPATAAWFPNNSLTNKTASLDGNYAFPVMAIRLTVTAYTSGSVQLTIIQAGMPGE